MELRQLEYFMMVSETRSFTRAAEKLFISQPAVTNAIRSLEDELEIQLFDRSQKQVLLTKEGLIFYKHVQQIMDGVSSTLVEISALKQLDCGQLAMGSTPLGCGVIGYHALQRFQETYPDIHITFCEGTAEAVESMLVDDKIELAFVQNNDNNLLEYIPLEEMELVLCCSSKHPLGRKNSIKLANLDTDQLILLSADCQYRQQIITMFESEDTLPKIVMEVSHVQTIKGLVGANCGLSILPVAMCQEDGLKYVPFDPPIYMEKYLAFKSKERVSLAAKTFIDSIEEVCH